MAIGGTQQCEALPQRGTGRRICRSGLLGLALLALSACAGHKDLTAPCDATDSCGLFGWLRLRRALSPASPCAGSAHRCRGDQWPSLTPQHGLHRSRHCRDLVVQSLYTSLEPTCSRCSPSASPSISSITAMRSSSAARRCRRPISSGGSSYRRHLRPGVQLGRLSDGRGERALADRRFAWRSICTAVAAQVQGGSSLYFGFWRHGLGERGRNLAQRQSGPAERPPRKTSRSRRHVRRRPDVPWASSSTLCSRSLSSRRCSWSSWASWRSMCCLASRRSSSRWRCSCSPSALQRLDAKLPDLFDRAAV